jgi:glycosyltransferase involved in cell wall biosynthesis
VDKHRSTIVFIDDARSFGGAQIAMARAIAAISSNTQVRIVCVCTPQTRIGVEKITGVQDRLSFVECPKTLPLNGLLFLLRLPRFFLIIRRLKRMNVRAWWLNLSGIEACLAPLVAIKMLGVKPHGWIHYVTGFSFYNSRSPYLRRLLNIVRDVYADSFLFRLHTCLLAPSRASAEALGDRARRRSSCRVSHLYPVLPPTLVECDAESGESCNSSRLVDLWMIGRIEYLQKNNSVLLDILDVLHKNGVPVRLSVIGDGPDLDRFRRDAERKSLTPLITYLGWQTNPWRFVSRDGIVVIPSAVETICLVALEAMSQGRRLTTTPLPEFFEGIPPEMIATGNDADSIARRIMDVSAIPAETVKQLYERSLDRFSERAFVDAFEQHEASDL